MSLVSDLIRWATYAAILGAFAFAGWRVYQEFKTFRVERKEAKK